jgi:hypothetical protein
MKTTVLNSGYGGSIFTACFTELGDKGVLQFTDSFRKMNEAGKYVIYHQLKNIHIDAGTSNDRYGN